MTQFHTDPNAEADATPDAETFHLSAAWLTAPLHPKLVDKAGWYWRNLNSDEPIFRHGGPFASEPLAIEDAQKGGA